MSSSQQDSPKPHNLQYARLSSFSICFNHWLFFAYWIFINYYSLQQLSEVAIFSPLFWENQVMGQFRNLSRVTELRSCRARTRPQSILTAEPIPYPLHCATCPAQCLGSQQMLNLTSISLFPPASYSVSCSLTECTHNQPSLLCSSLLCQ